MARMILLGGKKASNDKKTADEDKRKRRRSGVKEDGQPSKKDKMTATPSTPKVDKKRSRDRAKQKSENNRSLRKIKKRDVVRQMLHKFPKEARAESSKSEVRGSYDLTQVDDRLLTRESDDEEEVLTKDQEEEIYSSRKLLIRQMQGLIAKEVHGDAGGGSEYDSWSDLEENFARAYEPIPLDIDLATWRKMSKRDIIKTVRSKKMKKDFEYMSRSEILTRIEKMQKSARYLSEKFGVNHLLPQLDHVVQVHRSNDDEEDDELVPSGDVGGESEIDLGDSQSETVSTLSEFSNKPEKEYLSRSQILKAYNSKTNGGYNPESKAVSASVAKLRTSPADKHNSWSSRASSIMNNPESLYVSRQEVLKKLENRAPPPPDRPPKGKRAGPPPSSPPFSDRSRRSNSNNSSNRNNSSNKRLVDSTSWSSRASRINATSLMEEPQYISRAELVEKLADIAYDTLSNFSVDDSQQQLYDSQSSYDDGSDSEASTIKNVVLTSSRIVDTSAGTREKQLEGNKTTENLGRKSNQVNSDDNEEMFESDAKNEIEDKVENPSKRKIEGNQDKNGKGGGSSFFGFNKMLARIPFSSNGGSSNNNKQLNKVIPPTTKTGRNIENLATDRPKLPSKERKHDPPDPSTFSNRKQRADDIRSRSSSKSEKGRSPATSISGNASFSQEGDESDFTSMCSCSSCESYTDYSCSCCDFEDEDDRHLEGEDFYSDDKGSASYYSSSSQGTVVGGDAMTEEVEDVVNERRLPKDNRQSSEKWDTDDAISHEDGLFSRETGKSGRDKRNRGHKGVAGSGSDVSGSSKRVKNVFQSKTIMSQFNDSLLKEGNTSGVKQKADGLTKDGKEQQIYEPVNAKEIHRQQNERALKKHLREIAADWDSRINDLNTLRRGKVLKELKRYLRDQIDFDASPNEINKQVEVLLRRALDSNFEAFSNLNVGQMYIPMAEVQSAQQQHHHRRGKRTRTNLNAHHSKDSNTDYDTFGSIDSLIFEPKMGGSRRDIKEAQEAIEKQFQYLNNEDAGEDSQDDVVDNRSRRKKVVVSGAGKTAFAERVKLFQNLGRKGESSGESIQALPKPPVKKITFLDVKGQATSWKKIAEEKLETGLFSNVNYRHDEVQDGDKEDKEEKEEVSLCPDCSNPLDMSMSTCTICDYCTHCTLPEDDDEGEGRTQSENIGDVSYNLSSTAASWNFLNRKSELDDSDIDDEYDDDEENRRGSSDGGETSISCESVIENFVADSIVNRKPVMNLQRQLKEAFGATSQQQQQHNNNNNSSSRRRKGSNRMWS